MGKEYECCGQIIEVLRGEAINNRNTGMLLYVAMCRCNRNLLYVVREMLPDRTGEDHVNDVLSHLYDIPQQYAWNVWAGMLRYLSPCSVGVRKRPIITFSGATM